MGEHLGVTGHQVGEAQAVGQEGEVDGDAGLDDGSRVSRGRGGGAGVRAGHRGVSLRVVTSRDES